MSATSDYVKRQGFRVRPEKDHPVSIDINGDNFLDILRATDVGEGGLGIRVPHEFRECHIDTNVALIVHLPHPVNKNVTAMGKIRHISDKVFGVTFVEMSRKERLKLQNYIAYRIKDEPGFEALRFKLKTAVANLMSSFSKDERYNAA